MNDTLERTAPREELTKADAAKAVVDSWYAAIIIFDTLGNPVAMFQREHDAQTFLDAHIGTFATVAK